MGMTVRAYQQKDRERCRNICHKTATAPAYVKSLDLVATLYCDYYVDHEPENCFVVTDEFDNAVGYILCAENYVDFEVGYAPYIKKAAQYSKWESFMKTVTSKFNKKLNFEYPAHLHIDILDAFQGKGAGRALVQTLINHLKAKGVKGLQLSVGGDNHGAHQFYEKMGFSLLKDYGSIGRIYGMKL